LHESRKRAHPALSHSDMIRRGVCMQRSVAIGLVTVGFLVVMKHMDRLRHSINSSWYAATTGGPPCNTPSFQAEREAELVAGALQLKPSLFSCMRVLVCAGRVRVRLLPLLTRLSSVGIPDGAPSSPLLGWASFHHRFSMPQAERRQPGVLVGGRVAVGRSPG
jgi:hypothetical protein